MKKIPEKEAARVAGQTHYFTGAPCKRRHVCNRRVKDGSCIECSAMAHRQWHIDNRETKREITKRWRLSNPDKFRESQKKSAAKWRQANIFRIVEERKRIYWENPEKHLESDRARRAKLSLEQRKSYLETKRKWRKANPDLVKTTLARAKKAFKERHPLAERIRAHKRRLLIRENGGTYTEEDVKRLLRMQRSRCAYCRKNLPNYHVDHIIPLARGGMNDARNLQLLCAPCNLEKWCHDPIEFSRQRGLLL